MAKTTIYDLDGQGHEMETVDARECVAEMGWSFTLIGPTSDSNLSLGPVDPDGGVVGSVENMDGEPGEAIRVDGQGFDPVKQASPGPTREAMKSFLTTCGVTFPANIKGDKLAELYAAEKAKFEAE